MKSLESHLLAPSLSASSSCDLSGHTEMGISAEMRISAENGY